MASASIMWLVRPDVTLTCRTFEWVDFETGQSCTLLYYTQKQFSDGDRSCLQDTAWTVKKHTVNGIKGTTTKAGVSAETFCTLQWVCSEFYPIILKKHFSDGDRSCLQDTDLCTISYKKMTSKCKYMKMLVKPNKSSGFLVQRLALGLVLKSKRMSGSILLKSSYIRCDTMLLRCRFWCLVASSLRG